LPSLDDRRGPTPIFIFRYVFQNTLFLPLSSISLNIYQMKVPKELLDQIHLLAKTVVEWNECLHGNVGAEERFLSWQA
jgi:hypothetical protein